MEYVYATLLLESTGTAVTDASLTAVLDAAGVSADPDHVAAVVETFAVGTDLERVDDPAEAPR